jgi:hypothetical protein
VITDLCVKEGYMSFLEMHAYNLHRAL